MKYILVAVLIAIVCVGVAWAAFPDDALAYTDHRLTDVSRLSGNPQFLLQIRNQIHGYRYARPAAKAPIITRIERAPSPRQIVPPPTAVVDPRSYQQGVFPSTLHRPPGVLGPTEPTGVQPAPNGIPFTVFEDFEGKFAGNVNHDYALGWTGYTIWGQPTADGEFTTRHGGNWAQKISGYATWRGGIAQQFSATPNSVFTLQVWGHLYILGGGAIQVGFDPYGGVDPNASSVIWLTSMANLGQWTLLTAQGQALGSQITVFLEGYSLEDDNTNAYFDDFTLTGFS
jgi:hypothetical protein